MKSQTRSLPKIAGLISASVLSVGLASAALSQEAGPQPQLSIELNTVTDLEDGCRFIFMAQNGFEADLEALVLEAVLFTADGGVNQLTLLNFQEIPAGRPRVRQFDFPAASCSALGMILINGVHACTGADLEPGQCGNALNLSSRTDHEVLG